ncbi:MAG: IPT/TIG domain-containing protein [Planctomycetes bacterium]|nr:IPT/TIG domain-containing protein [Planctomycetota bacterium]
MSVAEAPTDSSAARGSRYHVRVRACGVEPRYRLLEAPAGATIDAATGDVLHAVGEPAGTRLRFTAEASCGLAAATASWTVEVTSTAPAVRITSFAPSEASYLGQTPFEARGANFTAQTKVVIDGARITPTFADASTLRGTLPAHAATAAPLPVSVEDPDGGAATLSGALSYVGPLRLASIAPDAALEGSQPDVTVTGVGFTPQTAVRIGGQLLEAAVFADARTLRGRAPALNPGAHSVGATDRDASGQTVTSNTLSNAYTVTPRVRITSFAPAEASYLGKTDFEVRGSSFTAQTKVVIDGMRYTPALVDATTLRGRLFPHAPTLPPALPLAVSVEDPTHGSASLEGALRYLGPLTVSGVSPGRVAFGARPAIAGTGLGFTADTEVLVGDVPLEDQVLVDARTIRGVAPKLSPGQYEVVAADAMGPGSPVTAAWTGKLVYEAPARYVPPPAEVEATMAEGTVQAYWFNPASYSKILVLDGEGGFLFDLPGNATFLEMNAPPLEPGTAFAFKLQGVVSADTSAAVDALAAALQCYTPPPLGGLSDRGGIDLPVFGGHDPGASLRCQDPPPGGGGGGAGGGGGGDEGGGGGAGQAINGFSPLLKASDALGAVIPSALLAQPTPNELRTGFELHQDADALEIHAFYRKIVVEFGVSLRGRLVQVRPDGTEGFTDELTFPDPLLSLVQTKQRVLYFRAQSDPGILDPKPQECGKKIPKGQYRLEIYTVGCSPGTAYYELSDDARREPIDIPGVPCPPYPWIEARDVTGLKTLPSISSVAAIGWELPGGKVSAKLTAKGLWTDAKGTHLIPDEPAPDFEYEWKFQDVSPPLTKVSGPILVTAELPGWNCYRVQLTVRDKACGREVRTQHEVLLEPTSYPVDPAKYTFQFPAPKPQTVHAMGDLTGDVTPAGGSLGSFHGLRPLRFRVFVVPSGSSVEDAKKKPAALVSDLRLAALHGAADLTPATAKEVARFVVKDLCQNKAAGPKYFELYLADAGQISLTADWPAAAARQVTLQGYHKGLTASSIGKMHLYDSPPVLETSFWRGDYDADEDAYRFAIQPAKGLVPVADIGPTAEVDFSIAGKGITIPSFENRVASGFIARFRLQGGAWQVDDGTGATSGKVLGSSVSGQAIEAEGQQAIGQGGGEGGGGLVDPGLLEYRWSKSQQILKSELKQTLFEAILYTGTIGPVPVTIWASVGLGLKVLVTGTADVVVAPFQVPGGGPAVSNTFRLDSTLELFLPAKIRADILLGVASVEVRLVPKGCFELATLTGVQDTSPVLDYLMNAFLSIALEAEACVHLVLTDLCYEAPTITVLSKKKLLSVPPKGPLAGQPTKCGGGGGAGGGEGAGAAQQVTVELAPHSRVLAALSPTGKTRLDCWVLPDKLGQSVEALCQFTDLPAQKYVPPEPPIGDPTAFSRVDPAGVFVNDNEALVAWTRSLHTDAPGWPLPPLDENAPDYFDQWAQRQNVLLRQNEIAITSYLRQPVPFGWKAQSICLVSDGASCTQQVPDSERRADGSAVLATGKSPAEALLAWVRYEAPDVYVLDGTKVVPLPVLDAQGNPVKDAQGNTVLEDAVVPNWRPQLEVTAIYARRVNAAGPIGAAAKLSPPGINIEPALAVAPSGNGAYCVWVHDPTHVDLIGSNRGRRLFASRWQKDIGWSAPSSIIANLADYDALYPGALEPALALKDEANGVLVFDALPAGADELDTGLAGGGRVVYAVHLVNGQWLEPVLLRDECGYAVYGRWVTIDVPDEPFFNEDLLKVYHPEWVMGIHEVGSPGTQSGMGGLLVSTFGPEGWSPPTKAITPSGGTLDQVAASMGGGVLSTLGVELPCAIPGLCGGGGGAGGGLDGAPRIHSSELRLEPDLAIESCRLSQPDASPGAIVTARIAVRNRGLAWSPVDLQDRPAAALRLVYLEEDGREREAARAALPSIGPGASQLAEVQLEAPHVRVRLKVTIEPNPIDRDRTNDEAECFFGAPCPRDLACEAAPAADPAAPPAVHLSWTSPVVYDQVLVYRDGAMIAALPGSSARFADASASLGPHTYCVRGRAGASKSSRRAECRIDTSRTEPVFRRGDANSDARANISDAVALFGYLFLGGQEPRCHDAADANDSGNLNITDGIYLLNFLFLGGPEVPPPGTAACGEDPTPDALPACDPVGMCG